MGAAVMGWLRLVAYIKFEVSFAKYSLVYRSLLQKRPVILSILLTEATLSCREYEDEGQVQKDFSWEHDIYK